DNDDLKQREPPAILDFGFSRREMRLRRAAILDWQSPCDPPRWRSTFRNPNSKFQIPKSLALHTAPHPLPLAGFDLRRLQLERQHLAVRHAQETLPFVE